MVVIATQKREEKGLCGKQFTYFSKIKKKIIYKLRANVNILVMVLLLSEICLFDTLLN